MSDNPMNKSRRDAIKMVMGGLAAVPLMNLVGMAAAQAEDLPHLDLEDPTAKALQYTETAPDAEKHCGNCQFTAGNEGDWLPCQLFPGKAVNAHGWCTSWTARAGA